MLNKMNLDWLFDMSVKRPHGCALANDSYHIFQTFTSSFLSDCLQAKTEKAHLMSPHECYILGSAKPALHMLKPSCVLNGP